MYTSVADKVPTKYPRNFPGSSLRHKEKGLFKDIVRIRIRPSSSIE